MSVSEKRKQQMRIYAHNYITTPEGRKYMREYRDRIRLEIVRLLGEKCSNPHCLVPNGCSDIRCLQIDHVNGGGRKELEKFNSRVLYYKFVLEQIKYGSKDYQLLCANCNWIKKYENKESTFRRE